MLAGFAAFLDPPKASAGQALQAMAASGVAVKIVTGDNERVTRHVCTQLGVPMTGLLTGTDLAAMDDDAPVSYTHLDVYKRQRQCRVDKPAGECQECYLSNSIKCTVDKRYKAL